MATGDGPLAGNAARRQASAVREPTSVYVHFPWCLKKCPYCDFASTGTAREAIPHAAYADAVLQELADRSLGHRALVSVFFGGGTPSLWDPSELGRVLAAVREAFDEVDDDLEVTVECNPTSLDRAKAEALRDVGVNRLSVGLQSLDADRLAYLGRLHDPQEAMSALADALAVMPRASGDLMFGMADQGASDFTEELDRVLATGIGHVSAYALTIEPGTRFGALHRRGQLRVATDDAYADTFTGAEAAFEARGLEHYEVSNYARPGEESRHNRHYWRGGDYLGLGAGAVGCMGDGRGTRRRKNDPRPERYLAAPAEAAVFEEALDANARIQEALMLGLRTAEGVDLAALEERVGQDPRAGRERALSRRLARGDLALDGARLTVPRDRWLHLDSIVADLF
jgi:putative oxygen-independent coproporphyrinogen III oxidase